MDLANKVLRYFNLLAQKLNFKELTADSVREKFRTDIAQQASRWISLARIQMLVDFGDGAECRAAYSKFMREFCDPRTGS